MQCVECQEDLKGKAGKMNNVQASGDCRGIVRPSLGSDTSAFGVGARWDLQYKSVRLCISL